MTLTALPASKDGPPTPNAVLIIDDNAGDAAMLTTALGKMYPADRVTVATTGREALKHLEALESSGRPLPDLILLDLKMPRIDGYEVLDAIKRQPQLRQVPVIILTASRLHEDIFRAYNMGTNAYLAKPLDADGYQDLAQGVHEFWLEFAILPNLAEGNRPARQPLSPSKGSGLAPTAPSDAGKTPIAAAPATSEMPASRTAMESAIKGPQTGVRRRAGRRLVVALLFMLVVVGLALVGTVVHSLREEASAQEDRELLEDLRAEAVYFDEALTMSARMAAATGNLSWEARYDAFDHSLNTTLDRLAALAPSPRYRDDVATLSAASDALAAMEREAFALTRAGRGSEGLSLLTGPEYLTQKTAYTDASRLGLQRLTDELGAVEASQSQRLQMTRVALGIDLFVLGVVAAFLTIDRVQSKARLAKAAVLEAQQEAERRGVRLEELKAADAFKARFIRTAAHELGNPLTPLRLHLATMRRLVGDDARLVGPLTTLDRNVARLAGLVQDLGDVGRMRGGEARYNWRQTDLNVLCGDALDSVRPLALHAKVLLEPDLASSLVVRGDPERLGQILLNLLNNAIKFTPEAGTVKLRLRREAEAAIIEVEDSGRGVSPEDVGTLFEPFVRVAKTSDAPGTGLGLYICRTLTEAHGGTITLASPGLGLGTTVTVRVPIAGPPTDMAVGQAQ